MIGHVQLIARCCLVLTLFAAAPKWLMHPTCSAVLHADDAPMRHGALEPSIHPFLDVTLVDAALSSNASQRVASEDLASRTHDGTVVVGKVDIRDDAARGACRETVSAVYDPHESSVSFTWSTAFLARFMIHPSISLRPSQWAAHLMYCQEERGDAICILQFAGMGDAVVPPPRRADRFATAVVFSDLLQVTCATRGNKILTAGRLVDPTDLPSRLRVAVLALAATGEPHDPQRKFALAAARAMGPATFFFFVDALGGVGSVVRVDRDGSTDLTIIPCLSCASTFVGRRRAPSTPLRYALYVGARMVHAPPPTSMGSWETANRTTEPRQRCEVVVVASLALRIAAHFVVCPHHGRQEAPHVDLTPLTFGSIDRRRSSRDTTSQLLVDGDIASCLFNEDVVLDERGRRVGVGVVLSGMIVMLPTVVPNRFVVATAVATYVDEHHVLRHTSSITLWHGCCRSINDACDDNSSHDNGTLSFVCRHPTVPHRAVRVAARRQLLSMGHNAITVHPLHVPDASHMLLGGALLGIRRCIDSCLELFEEWTGMSIGLWVAIGLLVSPLLHCLPICSC